MFRRKMLQTFHVFITFVFHVIEFRLLNTIFLYRRISNAIFITAAIRRSNHYVAFVSSEKSIQLKHLRPLLERIVAVERYKSLKTFLANFKIYNSTNITLRSRYSSALRTENFVCNTNIKTETTHPEPVIPNFSKIRPINNSDSHFHHPALLFNCWKFFLTGHTLCVHTSSAASKSWGQLVHPVFIPSW